MYTSKFDEIILESQIQLRRRFKDFEALPLQNMCKLFDFKLWPKSFNTDNKKWGYDIIEEVFDFYANDEFITKDEAKTCTRQWPRFRSRVSKLRT